LDIALRHSAAHLRLTRAAGPTPGEDGAIFAECLALLEREERRLRDFVDDAEKHFLVRSYRLTGEPLARARLALQLGLASKAINDVLLRTHSDLYGIEGLRLLIELLLDTGRAQDARPVGP
jgi:hypothetical protein